MKQIREEKKTRKACLLSGIHLNKWLHLVRLIIKVDVVVRWADRHSGNFEDDLDICLLLAEALLVDADQNPAMFTLSIFRLFSVTPQVRKKTLENLQTIYHLAWCSVTQWQSWAGRLEYLPIFHLSSLLRCAWYSLLVCCSSMRSTLVRFPVGSLLLFGDEQGVSNEAHGVGVEPLMSGG